MLVIGSRHWVVAVRIDQPDAAEGAADAAGSPDDPGTADGPRVAEGHGEADGAGTTGPGASRGSRDGAITADSDSDSDSARPTRVDRVVQHRANVDAAYRAYAIDQAYEKVRDIERGTVTPAMKRIEAEDPERHLVGLENSLKGKDRLAEKVADHLKSNPDLSYDQACAKVKDAIRYTFVYRDDHYPGGVQADTERLADRFELVDLRNLWHAAEYKGINTRWCVPESRQIFEVQFHTYASFDAKQFTHGAYEKIRDPATPTDERDKLQEFQRQVTAEISVPQNVSDIRDYP